MRWQGRRESDNVEDRRGQSGSPFGGGGGGGFRLPSGKGGFSPAARESGRPVAGGARR
ncbi:neutral zinc metallopeptidase [Klebsiella pneumoniae]|uniref:neutral zinc metallopeptidase n=1 Tax=Klebsiella pneumoniae TaxID=573 RepID=UPI0028CEAC1A|nr:neutral zinc metallopeptidase [Klebsiella pneumoniae]MDT8183380.1 neutral zinc metallopeptidase [Klebsiella pneumoniae]